MKFSVVIQINIYGFDDKMQNVIYCNIFFYFQNIDGKNKNNVN